MYETIDIQVDDRGVATLTLDRADKHNALSAQMIAELTKAAGKLGADPPAVRVVILTGAGKSFCAGGDLRWMQDQMAADADTRFVEAKKLAMMLNALNEMPKPPLIGRVQGQAFGGGVGMACVCDVAIGVETAKFGLTETRLGLIPATIGPPYVLARLGEAMARRVFMSARIFGGADEAVTLGLLARAVAAEDLDAAVEAEVKPYLTCAPPGAVAEAKRFTRWLGMPITEDVIDQTIRGLVERWESDEAQDGIGAFFDKRKPGWVGG